MSIYYRDEYVTLYHGDCLHEREWLTADVLITDPPYGIGGDLSHSQTVPTFARQEWDENLDSRDAALALWGERPCAVFGSPKRLDASLPHRAAPLVWDKGEVGMGDTGFPWRPNYELIYVNGSGWSGSRESSILRYAHNARAAITIGHPTPKPVGLMAHLISKAPPGIIADPFAGSGSTLVAAKALGRCSVGVELNETYCEIAAARLSQDTLPF